MARPEAAIPLNRHIRVERDRRWLQALLAWVGAGVLIMAALLAVEWPRLLRTSSSYRILELRKQVETLKMRERELESQLEGLKDLSVLQDSSIPDSFLRLDWGEGKGGGE